MRLDDVEVGAEYEAEPSFRTSGGGGRWRVRVEQVRVYRKVFDGWRYRASKNADGVLVTRILDGEDVETYTIRAAELTRLWVEAQREIDAREEQKRKVQTRAKVARARIGSLSDRLDALLGPDPVERRDGQRMPRVEGDVRDSVWQAGEGDVVRWIRVNLGTVDQVARLVEMAEAGARCRTEHLDTAKEIL